MMKFMYITPKVEVIELESERDNSEKFCTVLKSEMG